MQLRKLGILGLAAVISVSAAYAKKEPKRPPLVPLTPEQQALVEKATAQEKETIKLIQKSTPLVQTYIQNLRPDPQLSTVPLSDEYSLARVDFGKTFSANAYDSRKKSKGFFKGSMAYLGSLTKSFNITYSATGFMDMMFLDPSAFDMQHYDFSYVRRDFLGSVRTMVFDVNPKPDLKGPGRFYGRVWIEDRDGYIVRFNGSYTGTKEDEVAHYYHFDSWRTNVQPNAWMPTAIYVEETGQSAAKKASGFRAQTYFWGYSLKLPQRDAENASIEVENAQDQSDQSQDVSPLQAQRQWVSQAENNVLDRLTQAGLLAPPSDFDKVLETVTNNIAIGNKLTLPDDIHCRVMLTTPLESLAIGNTILISKGLIDVLPSEEDLAAVLSFQLAHIVLGHHIDTRYAFNDRLLFPDEATFTRITMNHTPADNDAAAKKSVELFNNSVYKDKSASVGLFFQQLQVRQKALAYLLTPRLGDSLIKADGTPWLAGLTQGAPKLNVDDLQQVTALPLNSHLRIDPWDDKVYQLNVRPAPLLNARDKMPFEVSPLFYRLQRYTPPVQAVPPAAPGTTTGAAPAATPAPADTTGTANPPADNTNLPAQPANTTPQAQPPAQNPPAQNPQ
jgi:hypothetical protein